MEFVVPSNPDLSKLREKTSLVTEFRRRGWIERQKDYNKNQWWNYCKNSSNDSIFYREGREESLESRNCAQADYSLNGVESLFEATSIVLKQRHTVSASRRTTLAEKKARKERLEKPYVVQQMQPAGSKVKSIV